MNNKKKIIGIVIITILIILLTVSFYLILNDKVLDNTTNDSVDAITIVEEKNDSTLSDDVNWNSYTTKKIELENSINITTEGVYEINGTLSNGSIKVNTKGNVKLILNNVTINNNNGASIEIENADVVYIELIGTNNISSTLSNDIDAAIYSSDDLILLGDGTLNITSNIDGIISKDDLMFISGNYNINTLDDGIRGKDSLTIKNGNFNIESSGNGIKTTNEEKGSIYIENGEFVINSKLDAIQSISTITIKNGKFNIESGIDNDNNDESLKGIKATSNILIENGEFNITSSDDAIHSNSAITIEDGLFNITTNDDGMHANNTINIKNGTININNSYEGIEANYVIIDNGTIKVYAKDDGINISGGANKTGNERLDEFSDNGGYLKINGGYIYVNSSGDGLDSNGSIYMSDGEVYVDGPTNNGNGALDYNGVFELTGGTLIAVGSSGMAQSVSKSTVNTIQIYLESNLTGTI